jgi:hypothetical protein
MRANCRNLRGGLGRELHVVRPAKFLFRKIDGEGGRQRAAIPVIRANELLIVRALLVPARQQARGQVHALAIPALRHHVHLAARVQLVGFLRLLRI